MYKKDFDYEIGRPQLVSLNRMKVCVISGVCLCTETFFWPTLIRFRESNCEGPRSQEWMTSRSLEVLLLGPSWMFNGNLSIMVGRVVFAAVFAGHAPYSIDSRLQSLFLYHRVSAERTPLRSAATRRSRVSLLQNVFRYHRILCGGITSWTHSLKWTWRRL